MKKTVLVLAAALFILCFGVHAAAPEFSVKYNSETNKMIISGKTAPGEYVTIDVFRVKNHLDESGNFSLNKAKSALRQAHYEMSVLVYAGQTIAEKNGDFSFDVKMRNLLNDSTGEILSEALSEMYAFVVKSGNKEPVVIEELYIDPAEQAADFDTVGGMSQAEKETVIQYLKDHIYSLGYYVDVLDELDHVKAYDAMYSVLIEKNFDVSDNSFAAAYLQKAIVMEALNQGKVDNVEDYEEELTFTNGELKDWYAMSFVDSAFKSELTDRLTGKSFKSLNSFEKAAKEAMVLEFVEKTDGLKAVSDILAEFDEDIWGKEYTFDSRAIRNSIGNDYSTADSLLNVLLAYKAPVTISPDSSASSGSSGSSGSSSGGITSSLSGLTSIAPTTTPVVTPSAPQEFSDTEQAAWAKDAINYMTEKGIVSGRGDGTFAPNDDVTRAEFTKILVNAFAFSEKADALAFSDVNVADWYYDFVSIAVKNGLARGMSEGFFGANEKISRQDMAVMLYNAAKAAGKLTETDTSKTFSDEDDIADYAKEAVNVFASTGVVNGTDGGMFAPRAFATRAQVVQIVYNLLTK